MLDLNMIWEPACYPLWEKKGRHVLRHTAARETKKTETEGDKTRRSKRKIRAAERESESA